MWCGQDSRLLRIVAQPEGAGVDPDESRHAHPISRKRAYRVQPGGPDPTAPLAIRTGFSFWDADRACSDLAANLNGNISR